MQNNDKTWRHINGYPCILAFKSICDLIREKHLVDRYAKKLNTCANGVYKFSMCFFYKQSIS